MLPSLRDSLLEEQSSSGGGGCGGGDFEHWMYIAYDAGDAFYDSPVREAEVRGWVEEKIVSPLTAAGVTLRLSLLRYENTLRKPGPAFNFMMAAAFADGADYLYRINDDTRFVGAWVASAVGTLRGLSPPNVGVVGPICNEGNRAILTHDFTHRTHLLIFDHYYPPIFSDWYMDDWITKVYDERMRRGPFTVQHMVDFQGTRYSVDRSHELALENELRDGRRRIEHWIAEHS